MVGPVTMETMKGRLPANGRNGRVMASGKEMLRAEQTPSKDCVEWNVAYTV